MCIRVGVWHKAPLISCLKRTIPIGVCYGHRNASLRPILNAVIVAIRIERICFARKITLTIDACFVSIAQSIIVAVRIQRVRVLTNVVLTIGTDLIAI